MLTVSGLSIQFNGNYLFDNVAFAIKPSDRIGLIGRNGAGKSTLLKILVGLEAGDSGKVSKPKEYSIGYLPQDLELSSNLSIIEEVKVSLIELNNLDKEIDRLTDELTERTDYESSEYHKIAEDLAHSNERFAILGGHSIDSVIEKTLFGLGFLPEEMHKALDTFSGGWRMRVALAKILLNRPDLILLDEPTNHLDIESIVWVENYLRNYEGSCIIVSHDKIFLDNITNRTIEIINGKTYDMQLPYTKFIELRESQKEQQLSAFKNQQRQIAQTERFIERFRSKSTLATRVQSKIKQLDKIERIELDDEEIKAMNLRFPEPPRSGRTVVEIIGLTKKYDEKLVLDKIDFAIEREDKIAFIGKNGEGKSTLSKIIAGIEAYTGVMNIGQNVAISYFAQHQANELNGEKTVFQTIDDIAVDGMRTKVRNLLGAFLFSGDAQEKRVKVLSGGEKSRLALAKLILQPANLLILDEPTNHLDMISKEVLKNALLNFKGSMIIVSHDRDFLKGLTSKTLEFKNKKIKEYGGGIDDYLYKHSIELIDDNFKLGAKNRGEVLEKNKSDNQLSREKRKENNKLKSKLKKEVDKFEVDIHTYEKRIAEIDDLFQESEFFNRDDVGKIQSEHTDLNNKLEIAMEKWSELEEQLSGL